MANNVNFVISFDKINNKAKELLNSLYDRIRTDGEHSWFFDIFVDGKILTYEAASQYSWSNQNIGPKWCYLEEWDDERIVGTSAWSAPDIGLKKLLGILEKEDPNIVTSISYEDEVPDFVGAQLYLGKNLINSKHLEDDDIRKAVIEKLDNLSFEDWDEEEFNWKTSEKEDLFQDNVWEITSNIQVDFIDSKINLIHKNFNDTDLSVFSFVFQTDDFEESLNEEGIDNAKKYLRDKYNKLIDELSEVDSDVKLFYFDGEKPIKILNISDAESKILNFNTKEEAQKIFKFSLTNSNTFVFLAIIKGNNHWSSGFLKMSKNTGFSVLGSYPGQKGICVQGYYDGDFDTGIVISPDSDNYLMNDDEKLEWYGIKREILDLDFFK